MSKNNQQKHVFTLQQQAYLTSAPAARFDIVVLFKARNQTELEELITIYASAGEDERIVEQRLPNAIIGQPGLRVELVNLVDDEGNDISADFPQLPFREAVA